MKEGKKEERKEKGKKEERKEKGNKEGNEARKKKRKTMQINDELSTIHNNIGGSGYGVKWTKKNNQWLLKRFE